jgi:hypothetical protein
MKPFPKKGAALEVDIDVPKALGKKMSAESDSEPADDAPADLFGEYADDAFAALKSGDKAGFRSALKSAIGACDSGSYDDEE